MSNIYWQEAERIGLYLADLLQSDGIIDPVYDVVLPHSYTTDFFAWLAALIFVDSGDEVWLMRAKQALRATLKFREMSDSYIGHNQQAEFHWEFKNLALLQVYQLVGDVLDEAEREEILLACRSWEHLFIDSANWVGMRVAIYYWRYLLFKEPADKWRYLLELNLLLEIQTVEGFFPDKPDSYSFQYHAYVLALLALLLDEVDDERVRESFLRGVAFIVRFIDPDGDFNYYGRGQRQLFGYGSLLYALSKAIPLLASSSQRKWYQACYQRMFGFVTSFRRSKDGLYPIKDGLYPIVLHDESEKLGWYMYNVAGDYLAFYGVFLCLSSVGIRPDESLLAVEWPAEVYVYDDLGLTVVSQPGFFAAFSIQSRELAEPLGLIHLWPAGESCFGGVKNYLSQDDYVYKNNIISPSLDGEAILWGFHGEWQITESAIVILWRNKASVFQQTYCWDTTGFWLEQKLEAGIDQKSIIKPIRLPIQGEIFAEVDLIEEGVVASAAGYKQLLGTKPILLTEMHNIKVKWLTYSQLKKVPVYRFEPQTGSHLAAYKRVKQKLYKLLWVITVKLSK
ncbi:MAG TPA: hypothetical protein VLL52_19915 [Anaerolineae bacterium]|nr:hypothetical protein [Anaerolineae bacterium]